MRQEPAREDLLREATALVERCEFSLEAYSEPVVVGFRRDGSASFFFGSEPVLQFNTAKQLRRAYWEGQLIKAERGHLVSLSREREPHEVILRRRDLPPEEEIRILQLAQERLNQLAASLREDSYSVLRQVPPDAPIVARVVGWLTALTGPIIVADRPHASAGKGRERKVEAREPTPRKNLPDRGSRGE